jgi:hypothetical protein
MSIQAIRRSLILPPIPAWASDEVVNFIRSYYFLISQQVNLLQSHFQTFTFSWSAGVANTVPLAVPMADTNYGVYCSLPVNLGAQWVTSPTTTNFVFNTAVAPGAALTGQFIVWSNS